MNPADFESTFTEAGDSETKEGLRVEEVTGGSLGATWLWLPRNVTGKEGAKVRLLLADWEVREQGALGTGSGVSPPRTTTAHCSSGCKSLGDP